MSEILKIISKIISPDIINKISEEFISEKDKKSVAIFQIPKRYERGTTSDMNKEKAHLGRKRQIDNSEREHNKYKPDNIIKKIKGIFFSNVISFFNEYVNEYKTNKNFSLNLSKLNYGEYVNNLKKEDELKSYEKKIRELICLNISSKCKNKIIKQINNQILLDIFLKKEGDNEQINYLLDMSFGEWIDIFTLKKDIKYKFKFNGLQKTLEKIWEDFKNDGGKYFSIFIFFLFNYKRWFISKKGRNTEKQKNLIEKQETQEKIDSEKQIKLEEQVTSEKTQNEDRKKYLEKLVKAKKKKQDKEKEKQSKEQRENEKQEVKGIIDLHPRKKIHYRKY